MVIFNELRLLSWGVAEGLVLQQGNALRDDKDSFSIFLRQYFHRKK